MVSESRQNESGSEECPLFYEYNSTTRFLVDFPTLRTPQYTYTK